MMHLNRSVSANEKAMAIVSVGLAAQFLMDAVASCCCYHNGNTVGAVNHSALCYGSLATKISAEEILVFPFPCEICHRLIFSKFDSFACASHGTTFDI